MFTTPQNKNHNAAAAASILRQAMIIFAVFILAGIIGFASIAASTAFVAKIMLLGAIYLLLMILLGRFLAIKSR